MSRIGKKPVSIPDAVQVVLDGPQVQVQGPKGKLQYVCRPEVRVRLEDDPRQIVVETDSEDRTTKAYHGLTRALIQNMVLGVTQGYQKKLEIIGVGYLASVEGDTLSLRVGYAHEVDKKIPLGLTVTCPDQTHVLVQGCDKQQVGEFAAEVRAIRKPEPYKGKGVRYDGEYVKIKPGKAAS